MRYIECDVNIANTEYQIFYCENTKKILYKTTNLQNVVPFIVEACLHYDTAKVHISGDFKTTMEVLFSVRGDLARAGKVIEVV